MSRVAWGGRNGEGEETVRTYGIQCAAISKIKSGGAGKQGGADINAAQRAECCGLEEKRQKC